MQIKVKYDNEYQILEVDAEEMWVCLSLEGGEDLTQEEKEVIIQDTFEEQFNRPEYNNWHKLNRNRADLKSEYSKDGELIDYTSLLDMIPDNSDEEARNCQYEYEELCQKLRNSLKPEYAEVLIATTLDRMTPEEYADKCNIKRDAVYKRLQRAKKKYKEIIEKCPI